MSNLEVTASYSRGKKVTDVMMKCLSGKEHAQSLLKETNVE